MDYAKALTCACLSQDIYKEFTDIQFRCDVEGDPLLIDEPKTDTQCGLLQERGSSSAYIIFRGSSADLDWDNNLNFKQIQFEFQKEIQEQVVEKREQVYPYAGKSKSGAEMHQGFVGAYLSVRDRIHDYVNTAPISAVTVTGHSLGGALATLCAVDIQYNFGSKVQVDAYTFGAPRAGNSGFRDSYNERVPNSFRFVNGMDIVPALPRYWQSYRHVEKEIRLGQRFSLQFITQRFRDHDMNRYIEELKKLAGA